MKTLVEHELIRGFFQHPEHLGLYLSKDGYAYNHYTRRFYPFEDIPGNNYKKLVFNDMTLLRSRAMATTFLEKPKDIPAHLLVVNHLDGNKRNDRLSKLEWTSYSGNSRHMYETGLRKDNTPILVKDLRTNSVDRFNSLQACARHFNVNGADIWWGLKRSSQGLPARRFYVFIREGENWPDIGPEKIDKNLLGATKNVIVKDVVNDKNYLFESVATASEFVGLKTGAFIKRIRDHRSKGKLGYSDDEYEFFYVEHLRELPKDLITKKVTVPRSLLKRGKRPQMPIRMECMVTGEVKVYNSSEEYCKQFGIKKNTFQKHVHHNKGVWKNQFLVRYLPNSPAQ
jgi:hypothetical protein